jgi:hypothetical protein
VLQVKTRTKHENIYPLEVCTATVSGADKIAFSSELTTDVLQGLKQRERENDGLRDVGVHRERNTLIICIGLSVEGLDDRLNKVEKVRLEY